MVTKVVTILKLCSRRLPERLKMTEPNDDLLALIEQPERKAVKGKPPVGMLSKPMDFDQLGQVCQEVLAVKAAGELVVATKHNAK